MKMEAPQSHDRSCDYSFGAVVQNLLVHDEERVGQRLVNLVVHCSLFRETFLSHFSKEVHHILRNSVIVVVVLKQQSLTHFLSHDVAAYPGLGSCELGGVGVGRQGNTTLVQHPEHHQNSL